MKRVQSGRGRLRALDAHWTFHWTSYRRICVMRPIIATFEGEREGPAPKMLTGRFVVAFLNRSGLMVKIRSQRLRILLFHREIVVSSCIGPTRSAGASSSTG